jgi:hypothetical protein
LVDVVEVVGALPAAAVAIVRSLEAASLHRGRAVDADKIEDRGRDVHERDQPSAPGARRAQEARLDAWGVQPGDREVDLPGPVVRADHQHRIPLEVHRPQQVGDQSVGGAQRLPPEGRPVPRRRLGQVAVDPRQVRGLDEHHAAGVPRLVEGGADLFGGVADPERRARCGLEQSRADRATGNDPPFVDEGDAGGAVVGGPLQHPDAVSVGDHRARHLRIGQRLPEGPDLGAVVEAIVAAQQGWESERQETRVHGVAGVPRVDRPRRRAGELLGWLQHLAGREHAPST